MMLTELGDGQPAVQLREDGVQPTKQAEVALEQLVNAPEFTPAEAVSDLRGIDQALSELVASLEPRDGQWRTMLFGHLQAVSQLVIPGVRAAIFGSTACGLHAHGADLDATLLPSFELPWQAQQQVVEQLACAFESSSEYQSVEAVTSARVPIVRLVHGSTGLKADVSIGNRLAILKTQLLSAYVQQESLPQSLPPSPSPTL